MKTIIRPALAGTLALILAACSTDRPAEIKTGVAATTAADTGYAAFKRVCLDNVDDFARIERDNAQSTMRDIVNERTGWNASALAGMTGPVAKIVHAPTDVELTLVGVNDSINCTVSTEGSPIAGIRDRVTRDLGARGRTLSPSGRPDIYDISGYGDIFAEYGESSAKRVAAKKSLGYGVYFTRTAAQ